MKNKILCFGLVLIFLTSMCGCNAEKADILESSDIADCSSSVSNTETSDETDTTVKSEPEKLTETAITTSEPISESNETAPTESKKPVEADKTDIPAAPKAETEKPKPEAPKPPVSEETKEPKKPVQSDKEPPAEQPTEEVKPKTAYDYEFDIEAIRSDLISLGCSRTRNYHSSRFREKRAGVARFPRTNPRHRTQAPCPSEVCGWSRYSHTGQHAFVKAMANEVGYAYTVPDAHCKGCFQLI